MVNFGMRRLLLLPLLALPLAAAAAGEPPRLAFPLGCRVGETCWVVGHMDHGVGTDVFDYACGQRSRDSQVATEIALRDLTAARDTPVLAMAGGRVVATRDGMADGGLLIQKAMAPDRACGNGVLVDHGDGWQSQYCHLRNGSLAVAEGDQVQPRQTLGMAGMSGQVDVPMLAVELRVNGRPVDPFLGLGGMKACGAGPGQLWTAEAARTATYRPADIAIAAFSDVRPTDAAVAFGAAEKATLTPDAPLMLLWTRLFGVQPGDELTLRILGPDGRPFVQETAIVPHLRQVYTRFIGQERRTARWPAGSYTGEVTLRRRQGDRQLEWKRLAAVTVP